MPKHTITKYRPLYIDGDGEILVLDTTGRYLPLEEFDFDQLRAFGKPVVLEKPKKKRAKQIKGIPDEADLVTPDETQALEPLDDDQETDKSE